MDVFISFERRKERTFSSMDEFRLSWNGFVAVVDRRE